MNLANLGAVYNGYQQAQGVDQQLRQNAMILQQRQAELDDHKQALMAQVAAYANMGQGGMGGGAPSNMPVPQLPQAPSFMQQGPQPPMPGQASVPSQPQPSQPAPGAPSVEAAGQRFMDRQAPAAPASDAAPLARVAVDTAQQQQPSELDPYAILKKIVTDVRTRNPGIDDETLAGAVHEIIGQMKAVSPDVRAQLQNYASMYRVDANTALGDRKIAASGDRLDKSIQSKEGIAEGRNKTQKELGQLRADTSIRTTGMRDSTSRANNADSQAGADRRASMRTTGTPAEDKAAARTHAAKLSLLHAQESEVIAQMQPQIAGTQAWKDLSAKKQAIRNQIVQLQSARAAAVGGGAPAAPAAAAAPAVATPKRLSVAEAAKLPSGTKFIGLDGVERTRQ